jgi:hypothetical protein
LGQELTARTHFQGMIRKRMVPVRIVSATSSTPLSHGTPIMTSSPSSNGQSVGEILSGNGHYYMTVLRLDAIAHLYPRPSSPPSPAAAAVAPTFTAGGVTIEPFLPDWWPNPE